MYKILIVIGFFTLTCCNNIQKTNQKLPNEDSIEIAKSSLGFYKWYLNCLKSDSTYNLVKPLYHWEDTIPIIDCAEYLKQLPKLGFLSDLFIESEKERFRICQDSLKTINHVEVDSCGCSVGEFYRECEFLDYFYWINTQEKYDGCEVKETSVKDRTAYCRLIFYFDTQESKGKYFDENFICNVYLRKYSEKWLIDSIERKFK